MQITSVPHKYQNESDDSAREANRVNPNEEIFTDDMYRFEKGGDRYHVVLTGSGHGHSEYVELWFDGQYFYGVTRNTRLGYVAVTCWDLKDAASRTIVNGRLRLAAEYQYWCDNDDELVATLGENWETCPTWHIVDVLLNAGLLEKDE